MRRSLWPRHPHDHTPRRSALTMTTMTTRGQSPATLARPAMQEVDATWDSLTIGFLSRADVDWLVLRIASGSTPGLPSILARIVEIRFALELPARVKDRESPLPRTVATRKAESMDSGTNGIASLDEIG